MCPSVVAELGRKFMANDLHMQIASIFHNLCQIVYFTIENYSKPNKSTCLAKSKYMKEILAFLKIYEYLLTYAY